MEQVPSLSRDVAELLVESASLYLDTIGDIATFLADQPAEDDRQVIHAIRRIGLEASGRLALANRLIDEGRIKGTLQVLPEYDPRVVQPLLRILGDCFALLAVAASREELLAQPLIEAELLKRALWREQIYGWVERCGGRELADQLGLDAADLAVSQMPRAPK